MIHHNFFPRLWRARNQLTARAKRKRLMAVATTLRQEVTELLQGLIRIDTTNPPGNETAAAELLRDYLEDAGVACELYAQDPRARESRCAHPGRGDGPTCSSFRTPTSCSRRFGVERRSVRR
jgi:acetylornithine deacetylase/succinyl-diaminopimelate desuccinylase-like protein